MQAIQVDAEQLAPFQPNELTVEYQRVDNSIDEVVRTLNRSRRPLLLVGNGVRLAHAEAEINQLIRSLDVPVVATWCAADLVPSENPLYVGRPGAVASRGANFALQNCDFLLAVGARLDFAITGYAPEKLARDATRSLLTLTTPSSPS